MQASARFSHAIGAIQCRHQALGYAKLALPTRAAGPGGPESSLDDPSPDICLLSVVKPARALMNRDRVKSAVKFVTGKPSWRPECPRRSSSRRRCCSPRRCPARRLLAIARCEPLAPLAAAAPLGALICAAEGGRLGARAKAKEKRRGTIEAGPRQPSSRVIDLAPPDGRAPCTARRVQCRQAY